MTELAQRYAKALFLEEQTLTTLPSCTARLTQPALWEALNHPLVTDREKRGICSLCLEGEPEVLCRFVSLLIQKRRMSLLPDIARAYEAMQKEAEGTAVCRMRTAVVPSEQQQAALSTLLARRHGKRAVQLVVEVDSSLLSGFVLDIDGQQYDESLRTKLRDLEAHLEEVSS